MGEYALLARRSGDAWFLGFMNNGRDRTFDVPLDFLAKGRAYVADIYSDDPAVPTRTHVKIERRPVTSATVLKLAASAQGGQAVRIAPAGK
jgi:alpha-glucosidase